MAQRPTEKTPRSAGKPFRWGIVGAGAIAAQFVEDMAEVEGAVAAAVTARTKQSAERFASLHGVGRVCVTFEEMLAGGHVDAVYVASPNTTHAEIACQALAAGKPVLVEKPLAVSSREAERVAAAAARSGVLAMEGLWTRFLPAVGEVRRLLRAGAIGEVTAVEAELSYRHEQTDNRFFDPDLGGGAALDLGVYPLSLSLDLLGMPDRVQGRWWRAETGVDYRTEFLLHVGKARARLACSFDRDGANTFVILGTRGAIAIQAPFLKAQKICLYGPLAGKLPFVGARSRGLLAKLADRLPLPRRKVTRFPFEKGGLQFEIAAFMDAVRSGAKVSDVMPLADSIRVLEIIGSVLRRPPER